MGKNQDETQHGLIDRTLRTILPAIPENVGPLSLVLVLLTIVGVASYLLWRKYGDEIVPAETLAVTVQGIEITPPPPWITSDVKREAIVAGSLTDLNMRQSDLTLRVAQAFSMHSWVAKVQRVSKRFPGRVIVELQYRQPVALVEVVNQALPKNPDGSLQPAALGVYPVDKDGVLLPISDFASSATTEKFPRIAAVNAWPKGNLAGTAWGDPRIHGAAQIAAVLLQNWHQLNLYRINAAIDTQTASPQQCVYHLETHDKTIIKWGHSPGNEMVGEPRDSEGSTIGRVRP